MNSTINVKKFGFAVGITIALLYLGCMLVMTTAGPEGTINFFNSLVHGLDVTAIIRMDIPLWEAAIGLIEIFILGWLVGACIAGFYNISIKTKI